MIRVNHVLTPTENGGTVPFEGPMMVVWVEPETQRLCLINLKGRARKPAWFPASTVDSWLEQERLTLGELPWSESAECDESTLPAASRAIRDRRFEAITPLLDRLADLLSGNQATRLVADRARELGKPKAQLYAYLYAYLRGGQRRNALLPASSRMSGQHGASKRRPSRSNSRFHGRKVTAQDIETIRRTLDRFYLRPYGNSLKACYLRMLAAHFGHPTNALHEVPPSPALKNEKPPISWNQFYYHARRYLSAVPRPRPSERGR